MVTITLPPELEEIVTERARLQGTTPELWTLDTLRQSLAADTADEHETGTMPEGATMLDFFEGHIGVLHSSEFAPGGAQMSTDTGRKFARGLAKKQKKGDL